MHYHSGSSRYVKLLGVAWLAFLFLGFGLLVAAIPACLFSLGTWLTIRKSPAEDFTVNTKPTFVMVLLIALTGWGSSYGPARDAGLSPTDAAVTAFASIAGVMAVVALIGMKVAPPITYADDAEDELL